MWTWDGDSQNHNAVSRRMNMEVIKWRKQIVTIPHLSLAMNARKCQELEESKGDIFQKPIILVLRFEEVLLRLIPVGILAFVQLQFKVLKDRCHLLFISPSWLAQWLEHSKSVCRMNKILHGTAEQSWVLCYPRHQFPT